MARVFISYARIDQPVVRTICDFLTAMEHDTWMDVYNLPAGSRLTTVLPAEIRRSDFVVLCLSRASVDHRGFVQDEMKRALEEFRKIPEGKIFLIPVRLDDCDVPESLRDLSWVDHFQPDAKIKIHQAIIHPNEVDIDDVHRKIKNAKLFSAKHEIGRQKYRSRQYAEAETLARDAYGEMPNPHSKLNEQVAACAQGKIIRRQLTDWVRDLNLETSGHGKSVISKGF